MKKLCDYDALNFWIFSVLFLLQNCIIDYVPVLPSERVHHTHASKMITVNADTKRSLKDRVIINSRRLTLGLASL